MRLLFYVSKLYSIPVVSPVFLEAERRGIPCAFYVSSKVRKRLPDHFLSSPVFTELDRACEYQPDYVLCPGNFVDFRLPGVKVELFHGIGIEKPSHYRIRHFFDYYFTSGPLVTERYMEMQRKHRYFRTFETGWPKIDHILNYPTGGLRERYGIPADNKVILYAPTHSRTMASADCILPSLKEAPGINETWFCKPHEFMNRDTAAQLNDSGITMMDSYDITPYLHLADVLISDTSSVVYEFMALDKPVVTFRTLGARDKGINIVSPAELREAVDRSLERPEEFSAARKEHMARVNPRLDGGISGGILDLLQSGPEPAGRKPLNLFRKMQVVWHGIFRKGYLR